MGEEVIVLSVPASSRGWRVDRYLQDTLPAFSRSFMARMIECGRVDVDGRRVKPASRLKGGEAVTLRVPEPQRDQLQAESLPLDILHEDRQILVLNKQHGLVVHPGAGRNTGTLVNGLLWHCKELPAASSPKRPGIVHRLDKDTSGVMVVAKTDRAYQSLVGQFSRREVEKIYTGLVWGRPAALSGAIDQPLGRSLKDRKKFSPTTRKPREALTYFKVLKTYEGFALLEINLATGRTHQIRVHLSHLGHPLVGDRTYGSLARWRNLRPSPARDAVMEMKRQALHATRLSFAHPDSGEKVTFTAPLAGDISALLLALQEGKAP